ncbi:MAG: response regulator [Deltaproteobacteria bacterium]|nr:response regulator [Deltaproteobacteria bacterium]
MKKRILAVDDSPSIRKLVEFSLKSTGFLVDTAQNGQEALEFLAKEHFDAVILDINMPKMDGFEFLKRFRSQAAFREMPVIMLTTEGQEEDKERALALGANHYIVKPFKPTELIAVMKNIFK